MDDFEQRLNQILNNPDAMAQITELASGLTNTGEKEAQENPGFPGMDEGMLKSLSPLISQLQSGSGREDELLRAIRPYVSERSQSKIDRAIHAAKVSRMAGLAWKTIGMRFGVEEDHGK